MKKGFTLAEVLIVLLIIGVVASLIISGLINDTQNAETVARVKKTVGVLSNSINLIKQENGGNLKSSIFIGEQDSSGAMNIMNALAPKLNIIKNCGTGSGCWSYSTKFLNGSHWMSDLDHRDDLAKAILSDGTIIYISDLDGDCNTVWGTYPFNQVCAWAGFDTNGAKGPNQMGRDFFQFYITRTGLSIPYYPAFNLYYPGSNTETTCDTSHVGYQCLSRVLREGAINY